MAINVRTNVNTSHLARLAIVACVCVGISLWSLYDGSIGYPNQQVRAEAYIKFQEDQESLIPKPDLKEIADNWKIFAAEKGWPTNLESREPRSDIDIFLQFVMSGITGLIGLIFLVQLVRWKGRWIEAIDETISSSRGHQFRLDEIVELDKKKWDKKGIAKVKYQADGGSGCLVIDDCNYARDTTQQILRHIEGNIDHSKIVNGKPEPPLEEKESVETV